MAKCKDLLERKLKVSKSHLACHHQVSDIFVKDFWSTRRVPVWIIILYGLEPKFDTLLTKPVFWNIQPVLTAEVASWDRRMNSCEGAQCTLINLEFGGVMISVMGMPF